ncbi:MAG: ShlB/FhaC/HecB family hemolysin secretion/activation protein [Halioglobus sp.]
MPQRAMAMAIAGMLSAGSLAQSNSPTTQELVGQSRSISAEETPAAAIGSELPTATQGDKVPKLPQRYYVSSIQVTEIRVVGNTLLDQTELDATLDSYQGRELTLEEIQGAANRATQQYIAAGYINSGVIIPDQDASDGIIELQAIEGSLNDIVVDGNDHLRSSYISKRVDHRIGDNLNVYEVEDTLRLMQQNRMIERVNARVVPGAERGQSILNLKVTEREPMSVRVGYNNHRSPSVGEDQGVFSFAHNSLTGNGDYLYFNYALTDGVDDISASYGLPITASDLTLETYYSDGESDIVESPFDELDIVSEIETVGVRAYQPVVRTLRHDVVVGLGFENTTTKSTLANAPFSFSPGEELGKSEVSLVRLTGEWTWRRDADAIYSRAAISQGVDWLDATDNSDVTGPEGNKIEDLPDSDFTALLIQSSYARALPWDGVQLLGRLTGQVSSDPLLSSQRLAVGGARSVRGYRENQLVRDNGVIASMEMRVPLFRDEAGNSKYGLTFAPFVDYGWAEDESIGLPGLDDPEGDDLLSVGAGLLWNWWEPLYVEVYYGEQLEDIDYDGDTLQEDGIHIQAYFEWHF